MRGYVVQFPPRSPEADGHLPPLTDEELRQRFTTDRRIDELGRTVEWVYLDGRLFTKRTIAPHDATPAARREQKGGPR